MCFPKFMSRGFTLKTIMLGAALASQLLSCGGDEIPPEGHCFYEVRLEPACFDVTLFKSLKMKIQDEAGLVRGFELSEGQTSWIDAVQVGSVGVNMLYQFYSPGALVGEERYLEIPSIFEDACAGEQNTLVVDCSALPISDETGAP